MRAELGPDWEGRFGAFDREPAAAASLGQVHRAVGLDGARLACKLQYPDMQSAVEADLRQLRLILRHAAPLSTRRSTPPRSVEEMPERLREELDYDREAATCALYRADARRRARWSVCPSRWPELSTRRLLTMDWLEGRPLLRFMAHGLEERNRIATAMFRAWW